MSKETRKHWARQETATCIHAAADQLRLALEVADTLPKALRKRIKAKIQSLENDERTVRKWPVNKDERMNNRRMKP